MFLWHRHRSYLGCQPARLIPRSTHPFRPATLCCWALNSWFAPASPGPRLNGTTAQQLHRTKHQCVICCFTAANRKSGNSANSHSVRRFIIYMFLYVMFGVVKTSICLLRVSRLLLLQFAVFSQNPAPPQPSRWRIASSRSSAYVCMYVCFLM